MSPPPLCQATTDFESDSEYLGTPVDPTSTTQPYVVDYVPLRDCYYDTYDATEYVPGQAAQLAGSRDPEYGQTSSSGLPLRTPYPVTTTSSCNQFADNQLTTYPIIAPTHVSASPTDVDSDAHMVKTPLEDTRDGSSLTLTHSKSVDLPRAQYSPLRSQYPDYDTCDTERGEKAEYAPMYTKTGAQHLNLTCDTNPSYPSPDLPLHRAYTSLDSRTLVDSASYVSRPYYDDGYTSSPIDDSAYSDRYTSEGYASDAQPVYGQYRSALHPHLDNHYVSGLGRAHPKVRFYQPPACPYSYPRIEPPGEESAYRSSPIISSTTPYGFPIIHAPRPQQIPDIHTLHSSTCPLDDVSRIGATQRILSIPSIPAPPPIPRPSSLIEDSPKKPLTLACFFCRKRKIACQSPPSSSPDRTCNQCLKRKLKCVYPATSRRGIRPRVYDLADEAFCRPPASLSV